MARKNDVNKPDYQNASFLKMAEGWAITGDLWGGTLDIRAKKKKYLPQFNREPNKKYEERLASSVFYNVFQRTVSSLVGMVFKNPITPEDAPSLISEMFTDIDLCGNDLEMFLREVFTNAVRDGHAFIFVDAPPRMEEGGTLQDALGRRPYWIAYEASQAVNWQYEVIDGRVVLTQITFRTVVYERAGNFGEVPVVRYKVLRRGEEYGTYEEFKVNAKGEPVSQGEKEASWKEIPVCVMYGRKRGVLESSPPLLELALLNILHYQKTSDFDDICHRICVPILARTLDSVEDLQKLVKTEKEMTVSAAAMMNLFGERADLKYVEVTGAGLEVASKRISELESQMAKLGLEMLAPGDSESIKTATEVSSDNAHAQSDLAVMAKNLETAVEQAFYFTAEMFNAIRGAGTVDLDNAEDSKISLKIDYDKLTYSLAQLDFIEKLVDSGKLSIKTFLEWLPQILDMPKNFNPDVELQRIKSEQTIRSNEFP